MTVGVNETADTAFRSVTKPSALNETLEDAYTVEVALETDKHRLGGGPPGTPSSPGTEWTLVAAGRPPLRRRRERQRRCCDTGRLARGDAPAVERQYTRPPTGRTGQYVGAQLPQHVRYRVTVAVVGRHHGRHRHRTARIGPRTMPARVR